MIGVMIIVDPGEPAQAQRQRSGEIGGGLAAVGDVGGVGGDIVGGGPQR